MSRGAVDRIERFEASLAGIDDEAKRRFYETNFLDLMGSAAAALVS